MSHTRSSPLTVLLVVNDPVVSLAVERSLRPAFPALVVEPITDAGALQAALAAGRFDVSLVDRAVRWRSGPEILEELRARAPDRPVLMLASAAARKRAADAMKAGFDDYVVTSPAHLIRLPLAIARALERAAAVRRAEQAERRLHSLLEHLDVLSHELRTPLNAMVGWIRLLAMGTLERDKARQALDTIERNAYAQGRVIDQILELSRIVSGAIQLERRAVDVGSVVRGALEMVGSLAQDKAIRLTAEVDPTAPPVLGDPARLQQAVSYLLSNAIKVTPRGSAVGLRLYQHASRVELAVTDAGPGIPAHLLAGITARFGQGELAGLGLTIARHLVNLHRGAIRLDSAGEGQGTTVIVSLPVPAAIPDPSAPLADRRPPPSGGQDTPTLHGLHILVVDNDDDASELVSLALQSHGARTSVAQSTGEALVRFEQVNPDVVVSDIGMPGEDGYSLIKRLRAAERGRRVPAIALTAFAGSEHRDRALDAGFDVHFSKPVKLAELINTVAELAARKARP